MRHHPRIGFSLVELSIVLVILGLLVGGVLSGQSLIHAAELRATTAEFTRYYVATQSFRDKYFALPGDMPNATKFWGVADPAPNICRATVSTTTATCDGDGNGQIVSQGNANEQFGFWKHLANAGLIEGSYTGVGAANGTENLRADKTNAPVSKYPNVIWNMNYIGVFASSSMFNLDYGNAFIFAGPAASGYNYWLSLTPFVMTPSDAWNIDTKVDDGKPGIGKVIGTYNSSICTTATSNTDYASDYRFTNTGNVCALFMRQSF